MTSLTRLCGVDEAGRGPWAGPVTAAAVILDPELPIHGLADSKKLTEKKRLSLESDIKAYALTWAVGWASPTEIDELNIREATFLAMRRAIDGLRTAPDEIVIDGNALPANLPAPATSLIQGDSLEPAISAASILAKTARDRLMVELCSQYPGYGFSKHKGYGTQQHATALSELGPCALHRRSFAPVAKAALEFG